MKVLIGNNRNDKIWSAKNIPSLYNLYQTYIEKPILMRVTRDEYFSNKEAQIMHKDNGGIVFAESKDSTRGINSILNRTAISLDADYADENFIEKVFQVLNGFQYVIYTTASHTIEYPKFRIFIALDKSIINDKYEPLCRAIMSQIGIEYFDMTSIEVNRLMFFPAIPRDDSSYYSAYHEGQQLNGDSFLKLSYQNYIDISEWAFSSRENQNKKGKKGKKKEDPQSKSGLIGAFCRLYDIPTVIENHLSDIYEPGTKTDRYTFSDGSSINGLIVYDDGLFAYSHHSTDPTCNIECNSFDLVRLHLFPNADDKKSTKDMIDFIAGIKEVIVENAMFEFEERQETTEKNKDAKNVIEKLRYTNKGKLKDSFFNYSILATDYLKDSVKQNEFTGEIDVVKDLPWRTTNGTDFDYFDIRDSLKLRHRIDRDFELDSKPKVQDAFLYVANENRYHPVKEYLENLKWDGIARADTLLIDFLGAEDSKYTRQITHVMLIGAIHRVYNPGCKFDMSPVWQGSQGCRKSLLIKLLGSKWGNDSVNRNAIDNVKEAAEQLKGCWIMEIAEMAATQKKEVELVKAFISRLSDKCRLAYMPTSSINPRAVIFIFTTNNDTPFTDVTGNRRYPLIKVYKDPREDSEWSAALNIDQIWAEMYHKYSNGDKKTVLDSDIMAEVEIVNKGAMIEDPWQDSINHYVNLKMPKNYWDIEDEEFLFGTDRKDWDMLYVNDIWINCLHKRISELELKYRNRINVIIKNLGYTEKVRKRTKKYGQITAYEKPSTP